MKFICLAVFLVVSSAACVQATEWNDVPTVDLTQVLEDADRHPLMIKGQPGWNVFPHWIGPMQKWSFLMKDLDSDGNPEILRGFQDHFVVSTVPTTGHTGVTSQINFPRDFGAGARSRGPRFSSVALAGPYQLDDDPELEIVAWATTQDRHQWFFKTVEYQNIDGRINMDEDRSFFLDSQPERRPDDHWDGSYAVIDTLNGLLHSPERSALVLSVDAGHDVFGRGVMAIDPLNGEVLWHFEAGPRMVHRNIEVKDLDGDGKREIVYTGGSTDNLQQKLLGQYSDDHTRLFVLTRQGREIWSQRLAGPSSGAWFGIADLDPSPGLEIISIATPSGGKDSPIQIWSSSGDLLNELMGHPLVISAYLAPASQDNPVSLLISTYNSTMVKFEFPQGRPEIVRQAIMPSNAVFFPLGISRGAHPNLFMVRCSGHSVSLLDSDFNILLGLSAANPPRSFIARGAVAHGRHYVLTNHNESSLGWELVDNPDALPTQPVLRALARVPLWAWALLVLTFLALTGWYTAATKHRAELKRRTIIPIDSDHSREARLHLLEDLELSGHGAIAPLRSLRRMIWLLDALKAGIGMNEGLSSRFSEIWTDCHCEDLPRLLVILERARAAGIDCDHVNTAEGALRIIQTQLSTLSGQNFEMDVLTSMGEILHQQGDIAESALQSLRRDVGDEFKTNLLQVVEKVIRANSDQIEALGVEVHHGLMAQAAAGTSTSTLEEAHCRMDPIEMEFILDNLVGNAVRAMESAETKRLDITWLLTNGMVKLQVKDTGLGIAAEDLEHIMTTEYSSKDRGGMGLPRSMRLLRKYGGQLSVPRSSPGQGTTFQLLLPRAK